MNNHYTKFQYKGVKTVGVTDYSNLTLYKNLGQKKCSTPAKMIKYSLNVHKIIGAHLQCVNDYYANLNIKECKFLELQIAPTMSPWMDVLT